VVIARRTPDGPYEVVSALGLPGWPVGEQVTAQRIIDAARGAPDRVSRVVELPDRRVVLVENRAPARASFSWCHPPFSFCARVSCAPSGNTDRL